MKKIINRVDDVLSESLAGFASAHGDVVTLNSDPVFVRRRELTPATLPHAPAGRAAVVVVRPLAATGIR